MKAPLTQLVITLFALLFSSYIRTRNIIQIFTTTNNQLIYNGDTMALKNLTDTLKIWIKNTDRDHSHLYPEKKEIEVKYFGKVYVTKAVVSIATDRGTSYDFYIQVQNEIERAYNELRQELALEKFHTDYKSLPHDKQKSINKIYPKRISEAEPIFNRINY